MDFTSLFSKVRLDDLLPPEYMKFSRAVNESLILFLSGLPSDTQIAILREQYHAHPDLGGAKRLGLLAKHSPVLHKIGQTLARNQRLPHSLRRELQKLEWLAPSVPHHVIEYELEQQLGSLAEAGVELASAPIAEASVAVVIPFRTKSSSAKNGSPVFDKVFKLLKPGIENRLTRELVLLEEVGHHLDTLSENADVPTLQYHQLFAQVASALKQEIQLEQEQEYLREAAQYYKTLPRVKIPRLHSFCTPRITSMERIYGQKLDAATVQSSYLRRQLADIAIEALIIHPVFSSTSRNLFHADPHAGNLLHTKENQLVILDWSQASHLQLPQQQAISKIVLAAHTLQHAKILELIDGLALTPCYNTSKLQAVVCNALNTVFAGRLPGFSWLLELFDRATVDAGVQFPTNVMLFRKSLLSITGIVEELTRRKSYIDSLLFGEFWKILSKEWPGRWFGSCPDSRSSHLSNRDLLDAAFSLSTGIPNHFVGCWHNMLPGLVEVMKRP